MRPLTSRQRELVSLIEKGLTYEEMADAMGVAPRTVRSYADALKLQLGLRNKRHIPAELRKRGLL